MRAQFRTRNELGAPASALAARRGPWLMVLAMPVLALAGLLLAFHGAPAANAATPVYAGCATQIPNFPTIQDAVNNVDPGGEVRICQGTYAESVNLSLMGSAIAGAVGDVTLTAFDAPLSVVIAPALGPAIHITETFTGNIRIDGLVLTAIEALQDGARLGSQFDGTRVTGSVMIANSLARDNQSIGFAMVTSGTVTLLNTQAISNNSHGFEVITDAPVVIDQSQAISNGVGGFGIGFVVQRDSRTTFSCLHPDQTLSITGSLAQGNTGSGFDIGSDFFLDRQPYPIQVINSRANDNANEGFGLYSACAVTVTASSATQNFQSGFAAYGASGVDVNGQSQATGNGFHGFCLSTGVAVIDFGDIHVVDSQAMSNTASGIVLNDTVCSGFFGLAQAASDVGAAAPGATAAVLGGQVTVSNTTANANGVDGIWVTNGTTVTIGNVTTANNLDDGIQLGGLDSLRPQLQAAQPRAVLLTQGFFAETSVANSLVYGNGDAGVEYAEVLPPAPPLPPVQPAAVATPHVANGNIICNNTFAGVAAVGVPPPQQLPAPGIDLLFDATGNWWGDASGPKYGAGGGLGNQVVDGTTNVTGIGIVTFTPWIDTIAGSLTPDPTFVGFPTQVQFQFSDNPAAPAVFLGPGVGNMNDAPPFTVTTDNGVLQSSSGATGSSVREFISALQGKLNVGLTPAVLGTTLVTLSGPCGQQVLGTASAGVVAAGIVVEKKPDLQYVVAGASAEFTVTITNPGTITLTQLAVDDPLAPACSKGAGVLPEVGPGQSTTYTCTLPSVGDSLTNVLTATAKPKVITTEPVASVSAVDTAGVVVGALQVAKTVGTAAGACASTPALTVTPGTPVYYCLTAVNTGDLTFTLHSVSDAQLGFAVTFPYVLAPGAAVAVSSAQFPQLGSIRANASVTNTVTITSSTSALPGLPAPVAAANASAMAVGPGAILTVVLQAVAQLTVVGSPTGLDPAPEPGTPPVIDPGVFTSRIYLPQITR